MILHEARTWVVLNGSGLTPASNPTIWQGLNTVRPELWPETNHALWQNSTEMWGDVGGEKVTSAKPTLAGGLLHGTLYRYKGYEQKLATKPRPDLG